MRKRIKVLVVDDDPVVLEVTRMRLEEAGYEVVTREDAVGTSTAVSQENPDVVLLDIAMPSISGEALARLIMQNPKRRSVSVIFHSSRPQDDLDRLARDCHALGSIQKTSRASMFILQFERLLLLRMQGDRDSTDRVPSSGAIRVQPPEHGSSERRLSSGTIRVHQGEGASSDRMPSSSSLRAAQRDPSVGRKG